MSWNQNRIVRVLLDALCKHEKWIDSFSDTKVQSKAWEEYRCM